LYKFILWILFWKSNFEEKSLIEYFATIRTKNKYHQKQLISKKIKLCLELFSCF